MRILVLFGPANRVLETVEGVLVELAGDLYSAPAAELLGALVVVLLELPNGSGGDFGFAAGHSVAQEAKSTTNGAVALEHLGVVALGVVAEIWWILHFTFPAQRYIDASSRSRCQL